MAMVGCKYPEWMSDPILWQDTEERCFRGTGRLAKPRSTGKLWGCLLSSPPCCRHLLPTCPKEPDQLLTAEDGDLGLLVLMP